jgi:hypothetical protein
MLVLEIPLIYPKLNACIELVILKIMQIVIDGFSNSIKQLADDKFNVRADDIENSWPEQNLSEDIRESNVRTNNNRTALVKGSFNVEQTTVKQLTDSQTL